MAGNLFQDFRQLQEQCISTRRSVTLRVLSPVSFPTSTACFKEIMARMLRERSFVSLRVFSTVSKHSAFVKKAPSRLNQYVPFLGLNLQQNLVSDLSEVALWGFSAILSSSTVEIAPHHISIGAFSWTLSLFSITSLGYRKLGNLKIAKIVFPLEASRLLDEPEPGSDTPNGEWPNRMVSKSCVVLRQAVPFMHTSS